MSDPFAADAGDDVSLVLEPVPASGRIARHAVVAFARQAGASQRRLDEIELCVSEVVTNVVRHAYLDGRTGPIAVLARLDDGEVVVQVVDRGRGLASGPSPHPGLGRGLVIVRELADALRITSHQGQGTTVDLRFAIVD